MLCQLSYGVEGWFWLRAFVCSGIYPENVLWIWPRIEGAGMIAETDGGCRLRPMELRCDYQVNPLGLDVRRPRLSWKFLATGRAVRQSGYQVIAGSSAEMVAGNRGDLFDIGKVVSDASVHVEYEGKELTSAQRVYWKVRVWDEKGKVSE